MQRGRMDVTCTDAAWSYTFGVATVAPEGG
jgi:hypothetical protein